MQNKNDLHAGEAKKTDGPSGENRFAGRLPMFDLRAPSQENAEQLSSPRKSLSFLRSSTFNIRGRLQSNYVGVEEDTVELVKQEINALQQHVNTIDKASRLHQNDCEPSTLQLRSFDTLPELHRKLIHIQAGLVSIEAERRHIKNKSERQQKDCDELQEKLQCERQEAQMFRNRAIDRKREAAHLREMNQELSQKVIELKMERAAFQDTKEENEVLRQKLCDAEQVKLKLDEQCQAMKRANERAKASLASCVRGLEKLSTQKQEVEEEKNHMQVQCQRYANENDKLNTELAVLREGNNILKREIAEERTTNSQLSTELESAKQELNNAGTHDHAATLDDEKIGSLQAELTIKSNELRNLRDGFDTQMRELMTTSSELSRLQDECQLSQGLRQEISSLEQERNSLRESLHSKETTIAEISAQLLKFDLEREYAENRSPDKTGGSQTSVTPLPNRGTVHPVSPAETISPSHLLRLGLSGEALDEVEACFTKIQVSP